MPGWERERELFKTSVQHLHWSERLSSREGGADAPNRHKGNALIVKVALTRMTNDRLLGHKRTPVIHTYELRLSIYPDSASSAPSAPSAHAAV